MFKNPLLRYPISKQGGLYTLEDLDAYDSELTQDLMSLHDEIHNNPVRGVVPDYEDSYAAQRTYNYTFNSVRNRLLPQVEEALRQIPAKYRPEVKSQIQTAKEALQNAQKAADMEHSFRNAGILVERGFSRLHDAIEIIRDATRKVPKGRSIKPRKPSGLDMYSSLNIAEKK
jgi:hypothetical protein